MYKIAGRLFCRSFQQPRRTIHLIRNRPHSYRAMGSSLISFHIVFCTVAVLCITYVKSDDVILQRRSERNRMDMDRFMEEDPRRKRPFCNAFTGCGKKRSDESMATLVELNSEPAVEELSKQILSEAKLWEAIQEAREELHRRHEEQNMIGRDRPLALTMTGLRKKRNVALEQITRE